MNGTADFNQGYEDGFNGTKTCLDGRKQFDNATQKKDYTSGHSAGRWAKHDQEWNKLTPAQAKARAKRETLQAIAEDYGFTDDAIEALDYIYVAIGPVFPTEGD